MRIYAVSSEDRTNLFGYHSVESKIAVDVPDAHEPFISVDLKKEFFPEGAEIVHVSCFCPDNGMSYGVDEVETFEFCFCQKYKFAFDECGLCFSRNLRGKKVGLCFRSHEAQAREMIPVVH